MADKDVNINFNTKADTKGTKSVIKEVENLNKALGGTNDITEAAMGNLPDDLERVRDLLSEAIDELELLDDGSEAFIETEKAAKKLQDRLEESAEEVKKFNEEFVEIPNETKNAGTSLKGMGKEADDAAESLKGIKALQVAEAIGEAAGSASRAAQELFSLVDQVKKSDGSFGDFAKIVRVGVGALTVFAVAARKAWLALGPIGVAILSLIAVFELATLALSKNAEQIDRSTKKQKELALASLQAAQDQKESQKIIEDATAKSVQQLNEQSRAWGLIAGETDKATIALRKNQQAQDEIANAELGLALAKVDANKDLNEVQKLEEKQRLRRQAELDKQRRAEEADLAKIKLNEEGRERARALVSSGDREARSGQTKINTSDEYGKAADEIKETIIRFNESFNRDLTELGKAVGLEEDGGKLKTSAQKKSFLDDAYEEAGADQVDTIIRLRKNLESVIDLEKEIENLLDNQKALRAKGEASVKAGRELRNREEKKFFDLKKENEELVKQIELRRTINKINNEKFTVETDASISSAKAEDSRKKLEAENKALKERLSNATKAKSENESGIESGFGLVEQIAKSGSAKGRAKTDLAALQAKFDIFQTQANLDNELSKAEAIQLGTMLNQMLDMANIGKEAQRTARATLQETAKLVGKIEQYRAAQISAESKLDEVKSQSSNGR